MNERIRQIVNTAAVLGMVTAFGCRPDAQNNAYGFGGRNGDVEEPIPTFTPEPTVTSTPTAVPIPVNLADCQQEDVREEDEGYVSENVGVRRRELPFAESSYDGLVNQNTRFIKECARDNWYKVSDGQGGFWILSDYVSREPISTSTPKPIATPRVTVQMPVTIPIRSVEQEVNSVNHKRAADLIFKGINRIRQDNGLPVYSINPLLQRAAEKHTLLLHQMEFLDNPDGQPSPSPHLIGGTPQSRASDQGYNGAATDIIAFRITDIAESATDLMLNFWQNSPGHYEFVVSSSYSEAGAGCAYGINNVRPHYPRPVPVFFCELVVGRT